MPNFSRRRFVSSVPVAVAGASVLSACTPGHDPQGYEAVAARTWRGGPATGLQGTALVEELVRCATLAPSSHNTQCWSFIREEGAITILPDLSRRCPAVDPDDHHLMVSLGCATENLVHAARAHGLAAEPRFDASRNGVRVALLPSPAQLSPLAAAIHVRQCTRGDYDGQPISNDELALLERAGTSKTVRMQLWTDRPSMERVLAHVVQANTAQMADAAFVRELKSWIRFNGAAAVQRRDGLFSGSTGNPSLPTWLGERAFGWFYKPDAENDKLVGQIRSSAGIAVFVGRAANRSNWVDVGRCYERFALQATALDIRNSFLNQPVEVVAQRPGFAAAMDLEGLRPDLVVRFGRGALLPRSLRRPVDAVLA